VINDVLWQGAVKEVYPGRSGMVSYTYRMGSPFIYTTASMRISQPLILQSGIGLALNHPNYGHTMRVGIPAWV
jgi:hypothetical protein